MTAQDPHSGDTSLSQSMHASVSKPSAPNAALIPDAIHQAVIDGDAKSFAELLSPETAQSKKSFALRLAAEFGRTEMARSLLEYSDRKVLDCDALSKACYFEHPEIVALLLGCDRYTPQEIFRAIIKTIGPGDQRDRAAEKAAIAAALIAHAAPGEQHALTLIQLAVDRDQTGILKLLLPMVSDARVNESLPLRTAANKGNVEAVDLLLPISDPLVQSAAPLFNAACMGYVEVVQRLIPHSKPDVMAGAALQHAAEYGHTEVVRALIPHVQAKLSLGLRAAARAGHLDIVELFLAHSPGQADIGQAFLAAASKKRFDIISRLLPITENPLHLFDEKRPGARFTLDPNVRALIQAHLDEKTLRDESPPASSAAPRM